MTWGLPAAADPGTVLPCVVFVDQAGSAEFTGLQRGLSALGVPSLRIDAQALAGLALTLEEDGSLRIDGRRIVPAVTWARHLPPGAAPGHAFPAPSPVMAGPWHALIGRLPELSRVRLPGAGDPGRLVRLRDAARAGVRTPRTIVTTDAATAAGTLGGPRAVVKPLDRHTTGTTPSLVPCPVPGANAMPGTGPVRGVPVIVQEYVEHRAELRVHHVDGVLRAFRVTRPSPTASRHHPAVTVAQVAVPEAVARAVRELAGRWELRYAAFDFLLTARGPVFLEADGDGDWHWYETRAGVEDVSRAVLAMVRDLHARAARRNSAPAPGTTAEMPAGRTAGRASMGRVAGRTLVEPVAEDTGLAGGAGLDARVLGPLDLNMAGTPLPVTARKARLLIAVLLTLPNEVVPTDQLIATLWQDAPPPTARKNLQVYISTMRRHLGDRISFHGRGYRVAVEPEELDLLRFRRLAGAGRDLRGRGETCAALEALEGALRLWRGGPLAEFAGVPMVDEAIGRFTEAYLAAGEDWAELAIEQGRPAEALARLDEVVRLSPDRERLVAARMRALAGCGRTSEALSQYESVRRDLAARLGLSPSPALTRLYEEILGGEKQGAA
ncbi:BTAD domain-containing putative transcriptional regulator [Nonomuraea sp. NPDC048892]|uniref:BTAD domain-containing putative transcriptional regulator n=1 Tax=Nonomuraea sp. NPDC048892 TaxID=3154624 RepID=UPI0033F56D13